MTDPRARSFGAGVDAYEAGRPEYAADHVEWLLDGVVGAVIDLGAGSGKLTRVLARLGFEVFAIEPDEQMLSRVSGVPALVGSAEAIPFPDRSVTAVTVGQAWHWFDPERAGREIARVLQRDGRLGLIWNIRDPEDGFALALTEAMGPSLAEQLVGEGAVTAPERFSRFEEATFRWVRPMTVETVLAWARSRSSWLLADAETRAATLDGVREVLATHPHSAGRETFDLPMITRCYRAGLR